MSQTYSYLSVANAVDLAISAVAGPDGPASRRRLQSGCFGGPGKEAAEAARNLLGRGGAGYRRFQGECAQRALISLLSKINSRRCVPEEAPHPSAREIILPSSSLAILSVEAGPRRSRLLGRDSRTNFFAVEVGESPAWGFYQSTGETVLFWCWCPSTHQTMDCLEIWGIAPRLLPLL